MGCRERVHVLGRLCLGIPSIVARREGLQARDDPARLLIREEQLQEHTPVLPQLVARAVATVALVVPQRARALALVADRPLERERRRVLEELHGRSVEEQPDATAIPQPLERVEHGGHWVIVVVGVSHHRDVLRATHGREEYEGEPKGHLLPLELPRLRSQRQHRSGPALRARHEEVEQYDLVIPMRPTEERKPLLEVLGHNHLVTGVREGLGSRGLVVRAVVNDQDLLHGGLLVCPGRNCPPQALICSTPLADKLLLIVERT